MRIICIALLFCLFACNCNNSAKYHQTTSVDTTTVNVADNDSGEVNSPYIPPDTAVISPSVPVSDSTMKKGNTSRVHPLPGSSPGDPGSTAGTPTIDTTTYATPKEQGLLNYDIPKEMKYRKAYTVRFAINRDTADNTIILSPASTTSTIHTSSTMSVELIDPLPDEEKAFLITKDNTDVQIVDKDEPTEWIFTVVPISGGTHELQVVVSIIRDGNKKQVVYSSSVQVHATMVDKSVQFFKTYWQWIIGTLLLPFIVWFFNSVIKKKKD